MTEYERASLILLMTIMTVQGITLRLTFGDTENDSITGVLDKVEALIADAQNKVKEIVE